MQVIIEVVARKKSHDLNYEEDVTFEQILEELSLEWEGIYRWFIGEDGTESGFQFMVSQTRETIPRLVSFARYLNERERLGRNRQMEYIHLAKLFLNSQSIEECHCISAMVFGARTVKELKAPARQEEKWTETVWEHTPYEIPIMSKDRERKERKKKTYVHRDEEARAKAIQKYEEERNLEEALLAELLSMGVIKIRELPQVHPFIRNTLLNWISSAQRSKDGIGFALGIHEFKLILHSDEEIKLETTEGTLFLADYELWFEEGKGNEPASESI